MQRIGNLERITNIHTKVEISSVVDAINYLVDRTCEKDREIEKTNEQLRKGEVELEKANEELRAADRGKEEFVSMVSHELKTPLSPIKLYSQMLLKSIMSAGSLNAKQKRY